MGSKVASNGGGVSVKTGEGTRVTVPAIGWKGVGVGVASAGAVTRYRVVGVAMGAGADGWAPQAETVNRSRQTRLIIRERMGKSVINILPNSHHGVAVGVGVGMAGGVSVSIGVLVSVGVAESVAVGVSVHVSMGVSEGRIGNGVSVGMGR